MPNWTKLDLINHELRHGKKEAPKPPKGVDKEAKLHQQIIEYCDSQWPKWKYIHSRMDQRSTMGNGAPDFVIFANKGRTYCFECKARGKKLTPAQCAWRHEMFRAGHHVWLTYSFEEFLSVVTPLQT